ncbi:MAG: 5-formyltetrahydrofolate cyclo-ligase [Peptococcaceae bacterium]|nr:5-formyltetrahydrofolate cyclo-ligase [Peptococcaceae bacterium]
MEISAIKNQLRKQYKQIREQLTIEQVKKNSAQIADRLFQTSFWQNSSTVMLYLSFQNEVMTDQIYRQGWLEGKTMLLPICSAQNGIMTMSVLSSFDQLIPNRYGIRELPAPVQQIIAPQKIDLCLIPGIAFDRYGNRLGFGSGYYDRYLAQIASHVPRIALAHSCQIYDGLLPVDQYDLPIHYMLTEYGLEPKQQLPE